MIKKNTLKGLNFKNQVGFTLIEIMVALLIISILMAFGIGYFSQYREKSQLAIAESMLTMYTQELVAFQLKAGRLPKNSNEYNTLLAQFKLDPNNNPQYNTYFLIQPDFNTNYLLAVPQRKHNYKSYARMSLNDFTIDICRDAPNLYEAKGGTCRQAITATRLNQ